MNSSKHNKLKAVILACVVIILGSSFLGMATAEPAMEILVASDAVRIFEDGFNTNELKALPAIEVFGIRGETISAQCAIAAYSDLPELTISLTPMKHKDQELSLPDNAVSWNFISGINILTNTPRVNKDGIMRPAPAIFPDCLIEEHQQSVAKGSYKTVYLSIKIPENAAEGMYQSTLTAITGNQRASIPLALQVYPLTLPEERHLNIVEWYSFSDSRFEKFHGMEKNNREEFNKIRNAYIQNMIDHRLNTFRISLSYIKSYAEEDGTLSFDFSRFDEEAQFYWDTGKMDLLETGFVASHGPERWGSKDISIRKYFSVYDKAIKKNKNIDGKIFLAQMLPVFVKHLKEKKWLDKTVFHICDEPSNHNVARWQEASDFIHQCAPELRRIDAIEATHCIGHMEVLVPKLDHLATWQCAFEEAQRKGDELWFYTVGIYQGGPLLNKTVDMPLIDARLMHWLNYRYNLKGYLHWGFAAWTDDPWNDPGKHRGDGWLVYPKKGGVLNSLRLEQMRNGIQDFECLWLLEDKISSIKAKLEPKAAALIDPKRRGVEIARQVIASYTDFSRDPEVLYAARRKAIEECLALDQEPRIIVQTNPQEHKVLVPGCTVDIYGWAEPGVKILLGRTEIDVEKNGTFFCRGRINDSGIATIIAEKNGIRKEISRQFKQLPVKE